MILNLQVFQYFLLTVFPKDSSADRKKSWKILGTSWKTWSPNNIQYRRWENSKQLTLFFSRSCLALRFSTPERKSHSSASSPLIIFPEKKEKQKFCTMFRTQSSLLFWKFISSKIFTVPILKYFSSLTNSYQIYSASSYKTY